MVLNKVVSIVRNAIKASITAAFVALLQEDCNNSTTATTTYWSEDHRFLRHVGGSSLIDDHHYYYDENADDDLLDTMSTTISRQQRSLLHGGSLEERVQDAIPAEHEADTYRNMWIGWSVMFAICGIASFCVWLAILLSKKANKSPFNYYLLYLLFPDWSSTLNCALTCALNAAAGQYISKGMCLWQSWYITWGVSTNAWLNAVVMYEIHRMLRSSRVRKRYFPPTRRRVSWNALYVNIWTSFVATWGLFSFPWLPHETNVLGGLTCNPQQHDRKSTIFLWLAFMPCFILIPYFYAIYVAVDVWRNKLLPPKGRRRFIAIYFFRIVCVFVVMWGPFVFCFFVLAETSKWVVWFGGFWGHLQTFLSAVVSTLKPDVAFAVYQMLTCKCRDLRNEAISFSSTGFSEGFARSMDFSLGRRISFSRGDEALGNRGGRRKAERRTNAITDASFRRALEQFSKENSIREQTGPSLGDSDNEGEHNETNDDEEAIRATAVTFGGNGTTPTSSHSPVDNVMQIESISDYDLESDQGDEAINDSSSPPLTPQSPRSSSVGLAEQLADESSLPRQNLEQQQPTDDSESSLHSINSRSTRLRKNNCDNDDCGHDIEDPALRSQLDSEPMENEITAGIVGDGLEADESELPIDPFNDDSNGDQASPPLPNKRRLSASQLRKIQEHLAASGSSLGGPSSSSTSGCSNHGNLLSEQGDCCKRNSLRETDGCDQSNGDDKDNKTSPAR